MVFVCPAQHTPVTHLHLRMHVCASSLISHTKNSSVIMTLYPVTEKSLSPAQGELVFHSTQKNAAMQWCSDAVMQWDCIVEACHQGLDLKVSRYIHCPKEDYKRVCTDLAGHEGKVQQLNVWIPDTISGKRAYSIPESSFTLRKQCWDAGEAGEQHEQQFSQEITLWRLKPTF